MLRIAKSNLLSKIYWPFVFILIILISLLFLIFGWIFYLADCLFFQKSLERKIKKSVLEDKIILNN